jgi:hypothetical protein
MTWQNFRTSVIERYFWWNWNAVSSLHTHTHTHTHPSNQTHTGVLGALLPEAKCQWAPEDFSEAEREATQNQAASLLFPRASVTQFAHTPFPNNHLAEIRLDFKCIHLIFTHNGMPFWSIFPSLHCCLPSCCSTRKGSIHTLLGKPRGRADVTKNTDTV